MYNNVEYCRYNLPVTLIRLALANTLTSVTTIYLTSAAFSAISPITFSLTSDTVITSTSTDTFITLTSTDTVITSTSTSVTFIFLTSTTSSAISSTSDTIITSTSTSTTSSAISSTSEIGRASCRERV